MKFIEALLIQPWVQHLGWTLIQFLWQGTLISIAYAVTRGLLGRSLTSNARYRLACVTLGAMTAAPVLTFLLKPPVTAALLTAWPLSSADAWTPMMPWLVAAWLGGVIVFSIRLLGAWRFTARLRSHGTHEAPPEWEAALAALTRRIGVSRPVRLLISTMVEVPTVVGWLRPVILFPVSALTGLAPEHVSALLAHELAHIRRLDYVVNVLQSIAEAVLFYHPAVWWVSDQIRNERELCCDDAAVAASGDILAYASALAQMESFRVAPAKMALASNGGSLVNRIRRLAGQSPSSRGLPNPGSVLAMALFWLAGIGAATAYGAPAPQPPPPPVPAAATVAPQQLALSRPSIASTLLFSPYGPAPQAPPPPAAAPKPVETASVEGAVVNDVTGEPLAKVTIVMRGQPSTSNPLPTTYTGITNAAGKFTVEGVPPGAYTMNTDKNGFLFAAYGETPAQPRGTPLTVTAGQKLTGIDFKLKPQGVITGRITNADGEPMGGMAVAPMQARQVNGKQQLMPVASQVINDLGEFRLFGLQPGRYYLMTVNRSVVQTGEDRSKNPRQEGYTDTYYPGTVEAQAAQPVEVTAGRVTQGVDIRLPKVPVVRIRGKVENLTGITGTPISITITPADNYAGWVPVQATPGPQGQFELAGVTRGAYTVSAEMRINLRLISAGTRVEVGDRPVDGVVLSLTQPVNIPGSVKLEPGGDATFGLQTLSVMLRPPGIIIIANAPPSVKPSDAGEFNLGPLNPGRYYLVVDPLPKGYYIKSARIGNIDVKESGIDLSPGSASRFEIVLSPKAGTITGSVKDSRGTAIANAVVALVPDSAARRTQPQWYASTRADAAGNFTLSGLTPGDYKLFSWSKVDNNAWMNPDVLRPIEGRGARAKVEESGSQQIELKVVE